MRLAGTGRDQPGVVQRVHDLRPLARLVVDLLVRARREKAGERIHDRQQSLARETGGPRDHVLLRDADLEEPRRLSKLDRANATVGREVGVENHDVAMLRNESQQLRAVRFSHVLVGNASTRLCNRLLQSGSGT